MVLAVDLPFVTVDFLRGLVDAATAGGKGIVPAHENGRIEPLVAVYPRAAREIADEQLRAGDRKLMNFVSRLETTGLAKRQMIGLSAAPLFTNWNSPGDIAMP
jgi:molybdopterin-guanine dinucleotide biosynthesis protein A